MYALEVKEGIRGRFLKLAKKDRGQMEAIHKKVRQILEDPHHFKPLRAPMQNKRRVHIGPFVLVYEIDEKTRTVVLIDYEHHDRVYGRR